MLFMISRLIAPRGRATSWLIVAGLVLVVCASEAAARDCGGRVTCRCGDRVVRNYELVGDLGPCKKHGLSLAGGVTLDGGGHLIRGSRAKSSHGVILNENATGARVKNLEIVGFERGLRLAGVRNARIENVEAHHNGDPVAHKGYGIDVARGASDNVLENVYVHNNADEGIHIGSGARGNRVRNSRFADNHRENVYFLENDDNSLENSTLQRGGTSSVFIKHATNVVVKGNRIEGRGIQIRGAASNIRLEENELQGVGITVRPYEKGPRGKTVPREVVIAGGVIRSQTTPCVRLVEARSVRVEGTSFDCRTGLEVAGDSDAIVTNTDPGQVRCEGVGVVREEKKIEASFVDAAGSPVARVAVESSSGTEFGRADPRGVVETMIPLRTFRCPGPRVTDTRDVVLRSGDWSRTLPLADLKGRISVGGSDSPDGGE